jgi:hypothetical protein
VNEETLAHWKLLRQKKLLKRYKIKVNREMGAGLNMGYVGTFKAYTYFENFLETTSTAMWENRRPFLSR